jgi:hypothetical protein
LQAAGNIVASNASAKTRIRMQARSCSIGGSAK